MKKSIICTMLLIFSITTFCQDIPPASPMTQQDYLKKSKTQKTIGFVLIGVGAATLIAISGGNTDLGTVGPLAVIGTVCILTSIPVFIASGKNKRRAKNASLSFNFEKLRFIQPARISFPAVPGIALKLHF